MIVIEYILYAICLVIGYIIYRIAWYFYPKKVSRKERYRTSEWDFLQNRFSYALPIAVVFGGIGMLVVYSIFNEDHKFSIKHANIEETSLGVEVKPISREEVETNSVSTKKVVVDTEATIQMNKNTVNPTPACSNIIQSWDDAHNRKDLSFLEQFYMEYVLYYEKELSKGQCILKKALLLQQYFDYTQRSTQISCEEIEAGYVKCTFNKYTLCNGEESNTSSYLFLKELGESEWKIEIENDE